MTPIRIEIKEGEINNENRTRDRKSRNGNFEKRME